MAERFTSLLGKKTKCKNFSGVCNHNFWQSFVYDSDLKPLREYELPSEIAEGWGIVRNREKIDGKEQDVFYVTDGSSYVYVVDPKGFKVKTKHSVNNLFEVVLLSSF